MNQADPSRKTRVATRNPTRKTQLARIHQAAHAAGFDTREGKPGRAAYEAELRKVCGRSSSRQARRFERVAIIAHFESLRVRRPAPVMTQEQYDAEEAELIAMLEVA